MATQVARTILERAAEWGRLRVTSLRAARERDRIRRTDLHNSLHMLNQATRLALLDMDGTLINGRFALELAQRTDRMEQLSPLLDNLTMSAGERSRKIAAIFAGVHQRVFEATARNAALMRGAVEMVVGCLHSKVKQPNDQLRTNTKKYVTSSLKCVTYVLNQECYRCPDCTRRSPPFKSQI